MLFFWFNILCSLSLAVSFLLLPLDDDACGGSGPRVVNASTPGVVASPGWPNVTYQPDTTCEWLIEQDSDKELELKFINFTLSDSEDCEVDYVEVIDGEDGESLLGHFCGQELPDPIMAPGESLLVRFVSGSDSAGERGFLARYGEPDNSPACQLNVSDVITRDVGSILTPDWPLDYRFFLRCEWTFEADEDETWSLLFADFETEQCCDCDFVQVFDGPDTSAPRIGAWFGLRTKIPAITSSSSFMTVTFQSDWSANFRGFFAGFRRNKNY